MGFMSFPAGFVYFGWLGCHTWLTEIGWLWCSLFAILHDLIQIYPIWPLKCIVQIWSDSDLIRGCDLGSWLCSLFAILHDLLQIYPPIWPPKCIIQIWSDLDLIRGCGLGSWLWYSLFVMLHDLIQIKATKMIAEMYHMDMIRLGSDTRSWFGIMDFDWFFYLAISIWSRNNWFFFFCLFLFSFLWLYFLQMVNIAQQPWVLTLGRIWVAVGRSLWLSKSLLCYNAVWCLKTKFAVNALCLDFDLLTSRDEK